MIEEVKDILLNYIIGEYKDKEGNIISFKEDWLQTPRTERLKLTQLYLEYFEAKRVRSDHSNDYEKFEELIRGILDETEENPGLPKNGKPTPGKSKSS